MPAPNEPKSIGPETIKEILHQHRNKQPRVHEVHYELPDGLGSAVISFTLQPDVTNDLARQLADKLLNRAKEWKFKRQSNYKLPRF